MKTACDILLKRLDGSGSVEEHDAFRQLRTESALPHMLLQHFVQSKRAGARAAAVFYSMGFARTSEATLELGRLAVLDRARNVRFRGCELLAYSLNPPATAFLLAAKPLATKEEYGNFDAALDAIAHQNHHYFHDRNHTGRVMWQVEEGDS